MGEIIDAHHHLWTFSETEYGWIDESMEMLKRDFIPSDLVQTINSAGIAGTVAVQARQTLEETRWLLDCAGQTPEILGVVGWLPLAGNELPHLLHELRDEPKLKGVRHVVQGEPDHHFILGEAFNRGVDSLLDAGLAYDILIYEHHLPQATAFARLHPQQRFVVDHLAKPKIARNIFEPWRTNLMRLADCPNVFCKVSGAVTEANWDTWTSADLEPYLDLALEAFGPGRLIAGSDWPVCLVASSYKRWWSTLFAWARKLTPSEQQAFFGGNACSFYNLASPATMF
jgi:L-fuconolactonase